MKWLLILCVLFVVFISFGFGQYPTDPVTGAIPVPNDPPPWICAPAGNNPVSGGTLGIAFFLDNSPALPGVPIYWAIYWYYQNYGEYPTLYPTSEKRRR